MNFQNLQNWEVEIRTGGVQGLLLRQREFRASLGYMKPIYKQVTFPSPKVFSFLKYQAEFPGNWRAVPRPCEPWEVNRASFPPLSSDMLSLVAFFLKGLELETSKQDSLCSVSPSFPLCCFFPSSRSLSSSTSIYPALASSQRSQCSGSTVSYF